MTKNIGLPRKKRYFDILAEHGERGDCVLDKNILYILSYRRSEDKTLVLKINQVDLGSFDGNLENSLLLFESENIECSTLQKEGKYLFLPRDFSLLFDLDKLSQDGFTETAVKKVDCESVIHGLLVVDNSILRHTNGDVPEKGMDLVDIASGEVLRHFDVDFSEYELVGENLIAGIRKNRNFAIFSLDKNEFVCELDSEKYFSCVPRYGVFSSCCDEYVAVAYNDSVAILSLDTFQVLHHVNLLDDGRISDFIEKYDLERRELKISSLSFYDEKIVVTGGDYISYVMCLDIGEKSPLISWVYQGFDDNQAVYSGGDVIFGVQEKRPTAWDVYSGEVIWEGSAGVIATKIQVGNRWLVYSSLAGYIRCFQWKKPYISPHCPAV